MFNTGTDFTMPVVPAAYANGGGNGFVGNDGWIWLVLIFAIFGGWGGNGFGGWGGNANGSAFQGYATRADINDGFATNNIQSGIQNISTQLCSGFNGVNTAILQNGNSIQAQLANLGYQTEQCCCNTREAIANLNFNLASQECDTRQVINNATRDIIDSQAAGTRAILDFLTTDKIASLQAENAALAGQVSQALQTQTIINQLKPTPVPAYITCSPYTTNNGCGNSCSNCQYAYGTTLA